MRQHSLKPLLSVCVLALWLGGCMPLFNDDPKPLGQRDIGMNPMPKAADTVKQQEIVFPKGQSKLGVAQRNELARLLGDVTAPAVKSVELRMSPSDSLGGRKAALIAGFEELGIAPRHVQVVSDAYQESGRVQVQLTYTKVVVPRCPDWSSSASRNFHNTLASNMGCANATNLGLMVEDPRDLERGTRTLSPDATRNALIVQQYRQGGAAAAGAATSSPSSASGAASPSGASSSGAGAGSAAGGAATGAQ